MKMETTAAAVMKIAEVKTRTKRAPRALRAIDPAAPPGRCVIRIPGQDIEMPVIFKAWIGDRPGKRRRAANHF